MVNNILLVLSFLASLSATAYGINPFSFLNHKPIIPAKIVKNDAVKWNEIKQFVDNFDLQNHDTYKMVRKNSKLIKEQSNRINDLQRFISNDEFFQPDGPIFIFLGGEWDISVDFVVDGHMHDMAKELNGQMFYTEHRYYGTSHPTK